jgi:hypothetical protein
MNLTNLTRTTVATLIVACATTAQTNAMMARYLVTLAGDACLTAGSAAIAWTKQGMPTEVQNEFLKHGGKPSHINQMKCDAEKIAPHAPLLIPGGLVLSVGGRLSMLNRLRGLVLAPISVPINLGLIAVGYGIRMEQAPDATIMDKAKDTSSSLYNRIFNRKNS